MRRNEPRPVALGMETCRPSLLAGRERLVQRVEFLRRQFEEETLQPAAGLRIIGRTSCQLPAGGLDQRLIPEARRGSSTGATRSASSVL